MKAQSGRNEFLLDMRSDEEGDHKPVDKTESREVQVQRLFEPRPKEMSEAEWVLRYLEVRDLAFYLFLESVSSLHVCTCCSERCRMLNARFLEHSSHLGVRS